MCENAHHPDGGIGTIDRAARPASSDVGECSQPLRRDWDTISLSCPTTSPMRECSSSRWRDWNYKVRMCAWRGLLARMLIIPMEGLERRPARVSQTYDSARMLIIPMEGLE